MSESRKLDPKEARFVDEYMLDLDPRRAALAAGYAATVAKTKAFQWVSDSESTKPWVLAEINKRKAKRAKRVEVSADRVLAELKALAFSNVADIIQVERGEVSVRDLSKLAQKHQRAIESVTQVKTEKLAPDGGDPLETVRLSIKMHSKVAALRMLMDHIGMDAPKKHEHSGPDGGPMEMKTYAQMSAAELEAEAVKLLKKGK